MKGRNRGSGFIEGHHRLITDLMTLNVVWGHPRRGIGHWEEFEESEREVGADDHCEEMIVHVRCDKIKGVNWRCEN